MTGLIRTTFPHPAGTIRAVIFQEGDMLVGQCLEYDIGAQAEDMPTLLHRIRAAINAETEVAQGAYDKVFAGIPKAPKKFFEMWGDG